MKYRVDFRVLMRGESGGLRCLNCPEEAVSLCEWVDQTRWWHEYPFGLCDVCIESFGQPGGFVYFIRGGDFVKIGFSGNPTKRLKELATASPFPLELWHATPGDESDEAELHRQFADERQHGEWFRISDRIRAHIAWSPA